VVTYDVMADGSLADPQTLTTASAPLRGLCIDDESNVYTAGDAGLEVFAPDGSRWGTVESPEPLTDCSFGRNGPGILLYLMSSAAIYGIDLLVDGPP
jgi:gluconolactonase